MNQKIKDAKNSVDSAHPHPEGAERLSEREKKAMELGGLMEHVDGPAREELHDQARKLGERARRP
jgi:hypothetical protein